MAAGAPRGGLDMREHQEDAAAGNAAASHLLFDTCVAPASAAASAVYANSPRDAPALVGISIPVALRGAGSLAHLAATRGPTSTGPPALEAVPSQSLLDPSEGELDYDSTTALTAASRRASGHPAPASCGAPPPLSAPSVVPTLASAAGRSGGARAPGAALSAGGACVDVPTHARAPRLTGPPSPRALGAPPGHALGPGGPRELAEDQRQQRPAPADDASSGSLSSPPTTGMLTRGNTGGGGSDGSSSGGGSSTLARARATLGDSQAGPATPTLAALATAAAVHLQHKARLRRGEQEEDQAATRPRRTDPDLARVDAASGGAVGQGAAELPHRRPAARPVALPSGSLPASGSHAALQQLLDAVSLARERMLALGGACTAVQGDCRCPLALAFCLEVHRAVRPRTAQAWRTPPRMHAAAALARAPPAPRTWQAGPPPRAPPSPRWQRAGQATARGTWAAPGARTRAARRPPGACRPVAAA